jgi:hypothetical protein
LIKTFYKKKKVKVANPKQMPRILMPSKRQQNSIRRTNPNKTFMGLNKQPHIS